MIEMSHIVVNGCSLTYCQGIEQPQINGWPALLAKKLGVPIVNLAIGGSGNDSIHRRTFEYFYKNKKLPGKPLYIIAFSDAPRREEFYIEYKGKKHEDFHPLSLAASDVNLVSNLSGNDRDYYELAHIHNMSQEAYERKKFIFWNSIVNLFRSHDIPYITSDYMPTASIPIKEYMKKNYSEIFYEAIKDKAYIGRLNMLTRHLKKLPCGHETVEAMPLVADHFYKNIIDIYGDVKVIPIKEKSYLSLAEYYTEKQLNRFAYNTWIK